MTFITINHLRKTYQMGRKKVHALADVSLSIEPNTFWAVMGPSGSGKSTLLYLLGGLDRPSSGEIRVGDKSIGALDENGLAIFRQQMIGFIFQSFNLIPSLSALVNNPQLILADEPTGNLDTASGSSIMDLLAELHQNGRTVLVVTHDPRMTAYATHTVHMLDGRIVTDAEYEAATTIH